MEQRIYTDNLGEQGRLRLHVADPPPADCAVMGASGLRAEPSPPLGAATSASRGYLFLKRVFDIAASLLLLGVFFPPLLIVALCIRWESPGPAIYRRRVLAYQRWDEAQGDGAL